jgi:hypothetical protein
MGQQYDERLSTCLAGNTASAKKVKWSHYTPWGRLGVRGGIAPAVS